MIGETQPSIARQMAAALEWWRDAGVDCDFGDEPHNWAAVREDAAPDAPAPPLPAAFARPAAQETAVAGTARIGGDPAALPQDLAAFAQWWMTEPSLDSGHVMDRVPPRGPAGAPVMVLVPEPEAGDCQTGSGESAPRLLSGQHGKLLDAMLGAMGIAPDAAYVASALPRCMPQADWAGLSAQGLGDVLRHHIALAAPQRLIVLGGNILPLLGHDLPNTADILRRFNHEGRNLPLLAGPELAILIARPKGKARIWGAWLRMGQTLTGQETA